MKLDNVLSVTHFSLLLLFLPPIISTTGFNCWQICQLSWMVRMAL